MPFLALTFLGWNSVYPVTIDVEYARHRRGIAWVNTYRFPKMHLERVLRLRLFVSQVLGLTLCAPSIVRSILYLISLLVQYINNLKTDNLLGLADKTYINVQH